MTPKEEFGINITTLAGSSFSNLFKIIKGKKIEKKFKKQFYLSILFSLMLEPFRWWENIKFNRKIKKVKLDKAPVFVLGHWRSGTTHLLNLLSQDPQFGYVDTFHAVFSNIVFSGRGIFKKIMGKLAPNKRPSDNMAMAMDFPQEEEFALGNMNPTCYYYYWFFPKHWMDYYHRFLKYEGLSLEERENWKTDYKWLIKKALLNTNGTRFLSKNPPNTARIKLLLEAFPDAKFVYTYRNPIMVFISTQNLYKTVLPLLQYQDISDEELDRVIFETYIEIMNRYEEEKKLIPEGNLIEISYEDFEKDNLKGLREIYKGINLPGFEEALPHFNSYLESVKKYEKNTYTFSEKTINAILNQWQFAMDRYNYDVPKNINIVREMV